MFPRLKHGGHRFTLHTPTRLESDLTTRVVTECFRDISSDFLHTFEAEMRYTDKINALSIKRLNYGTPEEEFEGIFDVIYISYFSVNLCNLLLQFRFEILLI